MANIGDTGFVIIRNGAVFKKSSPMVHEFNFPYAIGSGIDPLEAVEVCSNEKLSAVLPLPVCKPYKFQTN